MYNNYISLGEYIRHNEINQDTLIELGVDICKEINRLQMAGISPYYLRPSDIKVSDEGNFILGVIDVSQQKHYLANSKRIPAYVAPEVAQGGVPDYSACVYSLGLIMKYFVTDEMEDDLLRVINLACSTNILERYKSAADMQRELQKYNLFDYDFVDENSSASLDDEAFDLANEINAFVFTQNSASSTSVGESNLSFDDLIKVENNIVNGNNDTQVISEELASMIAKQTNEIKRANSNNEGSPQVVRKAYSKPKKNKKIIIIPIIILLLLAGAGCALYMSIPKEVTDIQGLEDCNVFYGEQLEISCSVEPEYFRDEPISYKSSDESVFIIDNENIIAKGIGTATLTATAKGYSEAITVTVLSKIESIDGIEEEYQLKEGNTVKLSPQIKPEEYAEETVTYASSDNSIVKVDKKGTITAVAEGEAIIAISVCGFEKTTKVVVTKPIVVTKPATTTNNRKPGGNNKPNSNKPSGGGGEFGGDEFF